MSESANSVLDVTAVILAGGMSSRLGRNKALEPFRGEPLIRRVIRRMSRVASDVIVVANDRERVADLDLPDSVTSVIDEYPGKGSLGGIYTGLRSARTEWAVFCACDMPFPSPRLYRALLSRREQNDAVVPVVDGRPEPIHAAYSRVCLEPIRERLTANRLKISGFFQDVAVQYFTEDKVRLIDPDLLSFFNINTQHDLEKANQIALRQAEL